MMAIMLMVMDATTDAKVNSDGFVGNLRVNYPSAEGNDSIY